MGEIIRDLWRRILRRDARNVTITSTVEIGGGDAWAGLVEREQGPERTSKAGKVTKGPWKRST